MKYRVVKTGYNSDLYQPQYFDQAQGWHVVYTSDKTYNKTCYENVEDAKEACRLHALEQPCVVWSDEF